MTCDEAMGALELLADGALDAADAARIERHFAGCAACRDLRAMGDRLGRVLRELAPPASPVPPPRGTGARPSRGQPPRPIHYRSALVGALVGAVLTVTLGIASFAVWTSRETNRRDEALAAVSSVVERVLADGVSAREIGRRTIEVNVGTAKALVDVLVTGGPGLYEVRARLYEPEGSRSSGIEVATLCRGEDLGARREETR